MASARQRFWIFVGLISVVRAHAEDAVHIPKAQITKPCDAATYLRTLATNADNILKVATSKALETGREAARAQLVAAASQGSRAAAAALIAAKLQQTHLDGLQALTEAAADTTEGLAAASRLAGAQELAAETAKAKIADFPRTVLATAVTSHATQMLVAKPVLIPAKHGACFETAKQREKLRTEGDAEAAGTTTITLITLKPTTPGSAIGQALTICGDASTGAIGSTSDGTSGTDTNIGLKGGNIFTTTPLKATRTNRDRNTDYAAKYDPAAIPTQKTLEPDLNKIKKLEDTIGKLSSISAAAEPTQLATSDDSKETIAKALEGEKASYGNTETKNKVEAFLKELFGDKAENVKTTIEKDLKELKPPKSAVGGSEEKKLETINDPKELAGAQIYYTVRHFVEDQEERKKNQANPSCPTKEEKPAEEAKKTADECKKHTTSEDCKKEKGCEFDDKKNPKCFPKESSSTPTAESNSFLIKTHIFCLQFASKITFSERFLLKVIKYINICFFDRSR